MYSHNHKYVNKAVKGNRHMPIYKASNTKTAPLSGGPETKV